MRRYFLLFGICFFCISSIEAQQSKIDSLKSVISLGKQDVESIKAMNLISYEYVRTDVEKAKQYLWKAKYLGEKLKSDRQLSATYSQLASINQNQSQIDSALFYINVLKELADRAVGEDGSVIKGNYYLTAGLYHKKSGNIKEALPNFIKTYEIATQRGDLNSASGQAINIGNSYLGLSDFNRALNYYLKALQGFEQTKNKKGQSFCYQNIGECYIELNRYDEARKYINKSIKLKTELQDKRGLGNAEQSLGRIYMGLQNYDKSLEHYIKALAISQELKLSNEEVKINLNLGKIYAFKNENSKALSYYEKSKVLSKKLGDSSSVHSANLEILAINDAKTKEGIIEKNAIENIQSFKETGAISREAAGYKNLATYYTNQKKYDKALEYTNIYMILNDSIRNIEIQSQFKNIEENYNKASNEKQIELLQKDQIINAEKLKQQRSLLFISGLVILFISLGIWMLVYRNKLKQRMKEIELRNQIAADLHDEVGSSLSSIYMLSQMAGQEHVQNKQEILHKVTTNAHETIDKMSDIVWMLKPKEKLQLKERMERFVNDLCQSRNLSYSFSANDLDTLNLSMHQSKNLYLIFKEAVNNAIKYANTTDLKINITAQNKKLLMRIEDQGIGFNESTVLKGNGLDNMRNRAKELKGELNIISVPEMGTKIDLSFPLV